MKNSKKLLTLLPGYTIIYLASRMRHKQHGRNNIAFGVWLSLARAPGLGPGGRRFESCHPDLIMREWLSWWSTTLPRLGSRVRVPSRALKNEKRISRNGYPFLLCSSPAGRKRRGLHSVPVVAKRTSSGRSATIMTEASC